VPHNPSARAARPEPPAQSPLAEPSAPAPLTSARQERDAANKSPYFTRPNIRASNPGRRGSTSSRNGSRPARRAFITQSVCA
jgi:hypothetical protein